jgi:hypothetical protein
VPNDETAGNFHVDVADFGETGSASIVRVCGGNRGAFHGAKIELKRYRSPEALEHPGTNRAAARRRILARPHFFITLSFHIFQARVSSPGRWSITPPSSAEM